MLRTLLLLMRQRRKATVLQLRKRKLQKKLQLRKKLLQSLRQPLKMNLPPPRRRLQMARLRPRIKARRIQGPLMTMQKPLSPMQHQLKINQLLLRKKSQKNLPPTLLTIVRRTPRTLLKKQQQ